MRKLKKIVNKIAVFFIKPLERINGKVYMKLYTKHLKKNGLDIPSYDGVGYINPSAYLDGTDLSKIHIGKHVTISMQVIILTHDFSIWHGLIERDNKYLQRRPRFIKDVTIGDNCFIGARSLMLPGSEIGRNTIVAAGSIVTKRFPNNVVIGGNPAKIIMTIEEFTNKHQMKKDYYDV